MKINRIFESQEQGLFSVKYEGMDYDEFERLFDDWQDIEFLEDFFNNNLKDLQSGFYGSITIEEAVLQTRDETKELQSEILNIYELKEKRRYESLDDLFIPLNIIERAGTDLAPYKAYGIIDKSWIRLYALKLEENHYIITGGCIKLTDAMMDRPHTQMELNKLNNCRDFLSSQGIIDKGGLSDI